MTRRGAAILGWTMWVVAMAAIVGAVFLSTRNPPPSTIEQVNVLENLIWISSWAGFGLIGALVVSSRPRNPIGWSLCGITFGIATALFSAQYARYALVTAPGTVPLGPAAAWLGAWIFIPVFGLIVLLVLLFPSGSLQTALGRWLARILLAIVLLEMVIYAFRPGPIEGDVPPDNPLGIPGTRPVLDSVAEGLGTLHVLLAITTVIEAVVRYRRARGVERQQFRWFVLAVAAFPVMFFLGDTLIEEVIGANGFDPVVVAFALGGNGIAAAIGLAVARYRLYDIDLVINRTLVYGALTGLLGLVYVGSVVVLGGLLPVEGNDLAVAGSTLAVAALFSPARRRIQAFVDRRFYRRRYDAGRTVEAFSSRLRDEVDLETLRADLVSVVRETLQPSSVGVWIKDARGLGR